MAQNPEPVLPVIDGLNGKIGVLERRLGHLERRLGEPARKGATKDFDRAEASALRAALAAMRYVGARRDRSAS